MKGYLFRAIFKKYWKLLLSMLLVCALGSATMTGLSSGYLSLKETLYTYVQEGGYPDAIITTEVTKRIRTEDLLALPRIERADARLVGDVLLLSPAGRYLSVRVMSFDEDELQIFHCWEQADPGSLDPVYLEYKFAHNNGISAGDTVQARIGGEYRTYAVAGTVSRPETLNMVLSEEISVKSDDFGFAYVPRSLLEKEVNVAHRDGMRQWQEKSEEFAAAEQDAQTEYQNVQAELADAEAELNEKRAEFDKKRPELSEQREELAAQMEDLLKLRQETEDKKAELEEQQRELIEKQAELTEQQEELDRQRAEAEKQGKELAEKKAEAASQQKELDEKKAEADAKKAELDESQALLDGKIVELIEGWNTLTEQKKQVMDGHKEAQKQLKSLKATLQELLDGQRQIEEARRQAIQTREELLVTRAELIARRADVESQLNRLRLAQTYLDRLNEAIAASKAAADVRESVQAAVNEIDRALSDLEAMRRRLEQAAAALSAIDAAISQAESMGMETAELAANRQEVVDALSAYGISESEIDSALARIKTSIADLQAQRASLLGELDALQDPNVLAEKTQALQAQLDALVSQYAAGGGISEALLSDSIQQAENGLYQIDVGLYQIDDGLRQIREGLKEADEKEAQIQDGLVQIDEGEAQLKDIVRQTEEALPQLDDALHQLWDGRLEIADYQAQIDEGWALLAEGLAQIDEYQAQLDEGFAQIKDYETQLAEGFAQIEDYQAQIDQGFAQIEDYQAQIDDGFIQIENGLTEIDDGLMQIDDGITQIDEGIAEAERQLKEGEEELNKARAEAETAWLEALTEFEHLGQELQDAWEELNEWEGYEALCNQFLLYFAPGASPEEVLREAEAKLKDAGVRKAVLFENSPVLQRIEDDNLIPLKEVASYFPLFFFGIAMIVVYLFMSLMIRQCRREIGILRALGFSGLKVVSLFCSVAFLVSLGAIVLGLAFSLAVRYGICAYYYHVLFHLPFWTLTFDWPKFFVSAALTAAVVQLATILSASSISGVRPSEAMTRQTPSMVTVPRLIQWIIRGASPFLKFSVISLFRNKLRFLFSSFCLAGSVMLIFGSLSLSSSTDEILSQVFERCIHYDCQIFVRSDAGEDFTQALAALPFVSDVETLDYYTVKITLNGHTEDATVNAVRANTELVAVEGRNKTPIPITGEGIILEKRFAERLRAAVGDQVLVNGVSMPVAALSTQSESRLQYMTDQQAAALGDCTLHSLICRVSPEQENELMQFLVEQESVLFASFTHAAYSAFAALLTGLKLVALVIIGIAIAIGLVIVVNTSQTNLLEQKRELCVLRTLGYQHSEISRYWFAQSILHFLVSSVFGFPAGIAASKSMLERLTSETRTYSFVNNPMDYILCAALVIGFIVFSHFLTMGSFRKWDIVEVVKEKE